MKLKTLKNVSIFWNCQPGEPIINHPIANQAWTKITVNPFHLYEYYYLLMIGYYSKFVIEILKNLQLPML